MAEPGFKSSQPNSRDQFLNYNPILPLYWLYLSIWKALFLDSHRHGSLPFSIQDPTQTSLPLNDLSWLSDLKQYSCDSLYL